LPRLIFGVLALALAVLAVVPAPTAASWQAALVATEWGHLVAVAALVPLLGGWRRGLVARMSAALCTLAAAAALTPIARAAIAARDTDARLTRAFEPGTSDPAPACGPGARTRPLDAAELFLQPKPRPVPVERREYVRRGAEVLTLDVRRPETPVGCPRLAPVVIVVHGGSWQNGSSTEFAAFSDELAHRGHVVLAITYRLSPRWRFPAARDDVLRAVEFVRENASTLGADARRIALLGRSAGGQLALSAGYAAPHGSIRGVVSLYGPTDLRYGYENPANPAVIDSRGTLEAYLGGTPASAGAAYDAASPVRQVGPGVPATLLIHGGRDELVRVDHSRRLEAALARAGRPHLLLVLPWATHGCDYNLSGPCGQISAFAIERFLMAVLK
jgi:acetyl esterase/lipase